MDDAKTGETYTGKSDLDGPEQTAPDHDWREWDRRALALEQATKVGVESGEGSQSIVARAQAFYDFLTGR